MNEISLKLTVFFEEPFWVGMFELLSKSGLSVCKIIFGAQPKDNEIFDFILKNYYCLRFSLDVEANVKKVIRNPKRIQREIHKQVKNIGVGTKSQQVLKLQQEYMKTENKIMNREQRKVAKERRFKLKQQKRKEKHRGK